MAKGCLVRVKLFREHFGWEAYPVSYAEASVDGYSEAVNHAESVSYDVLLVYVESPEVELFCFHRDGEEYRTRYFWESEGDQSLLYKVFHSANGAIPPGELFQRENLSIK